MRSDPSNTADVNPAWGSRRRRWTRHVAVAVSMLWLLSFLEPRRGEEFVSAGERIMGFFFDDPLTENLTFRFLWALSVPAVFVVGFAVAGVVRFDHRTLPHLLECLISSARSNVSS